VRDGCGVLCQLFGRLDLHLFAGRLGRSVFVRSKRLLDGDALEGCFLYGLLALNLLVVRKVLEVLGVVVRLVSLGLGCRVKFLCKGSAERKRAEEFVECGPSWCRKNSLSMS
jgi:hypothetical protein